jgi:neutral trehalase
VPLQENSHLVLAEQVLVRALDANGDTGMAGVMKRINGDRIATMRSVFFKPSPDGTLTAGAYYRLREGELHPLLTSEIANALWAGVADDEGVDWIANRLKKDLSTPDGLMASAAVDSPEQWDGRKFWAIPTLKAVMGLERVKRFEDAEEVAVAYARNSWLTYVNTGHTFEKNGPNGQPGGGGEYRVEANMTMTNETLEYLASRYPKVREILNRPMPAAPI